MFLIRSLLLENEVDLVLLRREVIPLDRYLQDGC